jgi:hypothetical protein
MLGTDFPIFKRESKPCRKLLKRAGHHAREVLASGCFKQGTTDMLRILPLALLTILADPVSATETPTDSTIVAQEQRPQQSPKRDCERKQDEGVS